MGHLTFLLRMKNTAKESRSRGRRCRYSPEDQHRALEFLEAVGAQGGSLEDAAELLSMHRATLESWLDRATTPGTDWPRVDVQVHVHLHSDT